MPDIWVILPIIVSAAVILLLYTIPPPWVKRYLNVLGDLDLKDITSPHNLGMTLRHAYSIEEVAGAVNAIIEAQKPSVKQFVIDEGIPFLAAAGSKEVAANARGGKSELAAAVGDLGSGAAGLQGLVASLAKPGKASGMADMMQYLPMIQQFMGSQGGGNGQPPSSPSQSSSPSLGGKLGGN